MIERLKYFVKRTAADFKASLLLNGLNILTVAVAMLILSFFLLIVHNVDRFLVRQEKDIRLSVYLVEGLSPSEMTQVERSIRSRDGVSDVFFLSKQKAKEIFIRWNRKIGQVVEEMQENPFPASFEVKVSPDLGRESVKAVAQAISGIKGVENVDYSSKWHERLSSFVNALRGIGIFLVVFLSVATVFLISNTIRLKVYTRRDEIGIMRIVGATDLFIKTPFVIEGVLAGFLGSLLALATIYAVYAIFAPDLENSLMYLMGGSKIVFMPSKYVYWTIGLGTAVGFFGSDSAVRKHLRSEP